MRGKIVFITGASSGIGEGCARKFASQGSDLILNARNVAKLEELKKELEATYGVRVFLLPFDTPLRVTNVKPGMVETNFSVVRYRGDKQAADNFYKGIRPLTGDDIAETVYFAASAPEHIQIAEILVMPTYQATGTISYKKKAE